MNNAKLLRILKLPLFMLLMLSFPAFAAAQGTIDGTVTDGDTGEVLPGAQVIIPSLNLGSVTDLDGNYTIENVPAGDYVLEARFIGYGTSRQNITVTSGQTTSVNFSLGASAINLDEVVCHRCRWTR